MNAAPPGGNRIALIIANANYTHVGSLKNPLNDAALLSRTLESLGFQVAVKTDVTQRGMKRAMLEFGRALRGSDAVGLFYYAGHAVQVAGENYLLPVNANVVDESEVGLEAVRLGEFLNTMERAQSRINIVILDACRNNPLPSANRSATRGLARVSAPRGTYIAYATSPGQVAVDGAGRNSPYTQAVARMMATPGITIEQVFKRARGEVLKVTGGRQTPWETSSITGEFYFDSGPRSVAGANLEQATQAEQSTATRSVGGNSNAEILFWESIKSSSNSSVFKAYLNRYPNGIFAELAQIKIDELAAKQTQIPPNSNIRTALLNPSATAIIPDSSTRMVKPGEIKKLSCEILWIARNEIYARNGYCFSSARAKRYFNSKGCKTSSQDILSSLEKTNVRTIRAREISKQCR